MTAMELVCESNLGLPEIAVETDPKVLLDRLDHCLALSIETVKVMAACVIRLDAIGVDISQRSPALTSLLPVLRRIGDGLAIAEVAVTYAGVPGLRSRISRLSKQEQVGLVTGSPVKVMLSGGNHLMVDPLNLTATQIAQVFAKDHLRSEAEQVAWLVSRNSASPSADDKDPPERRIDRKRNGIWIGQEFVSAADLAAYLGQLTAK